MELHPTRPPGRATRKALAYAAEIQRLHGAGYSLEAIRLALGSVGVVVSRSTVYREVVRVRGANGHPIAFPVERRMSPMTSTTVDPVRPLPSGLTSETRTGQAIAEAFMKGRITNPLLRERNPP